MPRRIAESPQLGCRGRLCEALRDGLLLTREHADREGMALDDRLVRLAARVDAGHQQRRVHADGGDGVGGHACQQRAVARSHHRHPGREAPHHRAQPGALLLGDRHRLGADPPVEATSHVYR